MSVCLWGGVVVESELEEGCRGAGVGRIVAGTSLEGGGDGDAVELLATGEKWVEPVETVRAGSGPRPLRPLTAPFPLPWPNWITAWPPR